MARLVSAVLIIGWLCAPMCWAQTDPAAGLLDMLQKAPPEVRAQASRLIAESYPALPADIITLINRERPNFFSDIQPDLDMLVTTKYSGLRASVEEQLRTAPQMQAAVDALIAQNYPDLVAEIRALPPGPDLAQRAAALIQTKYPDLLRDVLVVLQTQYPELIQSIQREVQKRFPGFIADAGTVILTKYPELTSKIVTMVLGKYPDLIPRLLQILTAPPPPPAPAPPAPNP
jgi:hypothetical protein